MRDIEHIKSDINKNKAYLKQVEKLNLGFLLKGLYYEDKSIKDYVTDGIFKITFDCHDTGVTTSSYIIKPDGSLYQIASRTYWYNESQYGFNKKWYESGAWDQKYAEFQQSLRDKLTSLKEINLARLEEELAKAEHLLEKEKSDVESMFL